MLHLVLNLVLNLVLHLVLHLLKVYLELEMEMEMVIILILILLILILILLVLVLVLVLVLEVTTKHQNLIPFIINHRLQCLTQVVLQYQTQVVLLLLKEKTTANHLVKKGCWLENVKKTRKI